MSDPIKRVFGDEGLKYPTIEAKLAYALSCYFLCLQRNWAHAGGMWLETIEALEALR